MSAQQNHTVWTAYLAEGADDISVGDCVVLNAAGTGYVVASDLNRAAAGRRTAGLALTAADDDNRAFELLVTGVIAEAISDLGTGTDSQLQVSSAGRLVRGSYDFAEDMVGHCDTDGVAYLNFPLAGIELTGGGGGGTPGGSDTQLQRNNAGAFGGISGATSDGTNLTVLDSALRIVDNSDTSKVVQFQASGLTTATTRTVTVPDADLTMVGTATTQTLTNKTIDADSNTITNIENADIKAAANIAVTKLAAGSNSRVLVTNSGGTVAWEQLANAMVPAGTIASDKLVAGSNGTYLQTVGGVATWQSLGATGSAAEVQVNNGSNVMTAASGVTAGTNFIGVSSGQTIPTSGQWRSGLGNSATGVLIGVKSSTGDTALINNTSANTWKIGHEDALNVNLYAAALNIWGKTSLIFYGTGAGAAEIARTGSDLWQWTATKIQATGNARIKVYGDIASVQTTDATVTSVFTWTIVDECATFAIASVTACRSTGAETAAYVRRCRIKRDGGTVTVGTVEDNYTSEEAAGWDCTIDNSTSTGRVRVTGAGSTTIDWGCNMHREETTHA